MQGKWENDWFDCCSGTANKNRAASLFISEYKKIEGDIAASEKHHFVHKQLKFRMIFCWITHIDIMDDERFFLHCRSFFEISE